MKPLKYKLHQVSTTMLRAEACVPQTYEGPMLPVLPMNFEVWTSSLLSWSLEASQLISSRFSVPKPTPKLNFYLTASPIKRVTTKQS